MPQNFDPTITVIAGMGTVFLVLLIMILVISLMKHFSGGSKKTVAAKTDTDPIPAQTGNELVAVIAAAIAASMGTSVASFRIASIETGSGGFNTPVWGHVNRIHGDQR
jgi:sodium pump decarboxylase gamma subunit